MSDSDKKYWQSMNDSMEESSLAPSPKEEASSSWWLAGWPSSPSSSTDAAEMDKEEENRDDPSATPKEKVSSSWWLGGWPSSPSSSTDAAEMKKDEENQDDPSAAVCSTTAVKKPTVLHRASTASTVIDSWHFGSTQHGDDYDDEGMEIKLNTRSNGLFCFATRKRRILLVIMAVVTLVVILISVLATTIPSRSTRGGANAASSTSTTTSSPQDEDNDTNIKKNTTNIVDADGGSNSSTTNEDETSDGDGGNEAETETNLALDLQTPEKPFSLLDPTNDLNMFGIVHARTPPTLVGSTSSQLPLETNAWYQNLLTGATATTLPTAAHMAYTVPYVVDAIGPIPGLRLKPNYVTATSTSIQLNTDDSHGLTLGISTSSNTTYSVLSTNPLGLTLQWNAFPMKSTIVRGMPYATMQYPLALLNNDDNDLEPTIASNVALDGPMVIDQETELNECNQESFHVQRELQLTLVSDFTWIIFASQPVKMKCFSLEGKIELRVGHIPEQEKYSQDELTIRVALVTTCSNGNNAVYCDTLGESQNKTSYATLLRDGANLVPGPNADVRYDVDLSKDEAVLRLDWNAQDMTRQEDPLEKELLMYALPHQWNRMDNSIAECTPSLIGSACVVSGNVWDLQEKVPITSWRAPRPPIVSALPAIAQALKRDIHYVIPDNLQRGAGDTYFSGKILARVARVLMITEELIDLCNGQAVGYELTDEEKQEYVDGCKGIELPTEEEVSSALADLRSSVEVWINGTAEASFVYDSAWGGVINCGCIWNGGGCSNSLPDCPALIDEGLNFGSAYYNDHHFHYGYHIYAGAAVAHFDKAWAREHFEETLLLVRDIANPSSEDPFFPRFRNKDWYQGSSWASGVQATFVNGMNQESSSEAIASYEAVALFGKEMMAAWNDVDEPSKVEVSKNIRDTGIVLAASEIRSVDHYWHVRHSDESMQIYPPEYEAGVVGILWSTRADFTTWFGNSPYLMYGIQLLPLTPISENRDASQEWLREMYTPLANSCAADARCTTEGWSVLQLAILASIGNGDQAMEYAQQIPSSAYNTAGGNGHSLTNALHYMATRPFVEDPADVSELVNGGEVVPQTNTFAQVDCGVPETCTSDVLDVYAGDYTCRDRIIWLMTAQQMTQDNSCQQVGRDEYPDVCGPCAP